jgi:hypothetical protein
MKVNIYISGTEINSDICSTWIALTNASFVVASLELIQEKNPEQYNSLLKSLNMYCVHSRISDSYFDSINKYGDNLFSRIDGSSNYASWIKNDSDLFKQSILEEFEFPNSLLLKKDKVQMIVDKFEHFHQIRIQKLLLSINEKEHILKSSFMEMIEQALSSEKSLYDFTVDEIVNWASFELNGQTSLLSYASTQNSLELIITFIAYWGIENYSLTKDVLLLIYGFLKRHLKIINNNTQVLKESNSKETPKSKGEIIVAQLMPAFSDFSVVDIEISHGDEMIKIKMKK